VLIQFFVCLALTLAAFWIKDALPPLIGGQPIDRVIDQIFSLAVFFHDPLLAGLYLSAPYLFMLFLDIRSHRDYKRKIVLQKLEGAYLEDVTVEEQKDYLKT